MITIVTQNHAIVNISNFSHISINKDENDNFYYIMMDGVIVLGQYADVESAIQVIHWIANTIGTHTANENLSISMPYIVDNAYQEETKEEENNDTDNA